MPRKGFWYYGPIQLTLFFGPLFYFVIKFGFILGPIAGVSFNVLFYAVILKILRLFGIEFGTTGDFLLKY